MSKSIVDMIGSISENGVFRPSKYLADISLPTFLNTSRDERIDLSMRAERVTIPAKTLSTTPYGTAFKNELQVPIGYENFEPLSMSIILSEDMRERKLFVEWLEKIIDQTNSYDIMFLDDIVGSVKVRTYTEERFGQSVNSMYTFVDAYPTSVGDIELSYGENDAYGTVTITFAYRNMYTSNL